MITAFICLLFLQNTGDCGGAEGKAVQVVFGCGTCYNKTVQSDVIRGDCLKRLTTKEMLVASFRELAGRKNIDKITVRDIAENGGYSTATFYRHFKDKYDLIAWDYAEGTAETMSRRSCSSRRSASTKHNYYKAQTRVKAAAIIRVFMPALRGCLTADVFAVCRQ